MRRPKPSPLLPLLSVLSVIQITSANAATWYVDASAISGAGTSWKEPFNTIGEAVAAAGNGDSVWVAEGEYNEEIEIFKSIDLIGGYRSGSGERNPITYHTIISAMHLSENPIEVSAGSFSVDGFTVRDGHLPFAIYNANGCVRNCIIQRNASPTRAGGLGIKESTIEISNCLIRNNYANSSGGGLAVLDNSTVSMTDCVVEDNEGFGNGGGVLCHNSNLRMSGCIIRRNESQHSGGDTAAESGGLFFGGLGAGTFVMENTLIYDNKARDHREVLVRSPSYLINNCTIIGKFPKDIQLVLSGSISNSILWGSNDLVDLRETESFTLTYSNIQGGYPGEGNISDDPLFRDPANGDFRLQHNSPCIDVGAMTGPADDLDGKPRPIDIPGVGREGDNAFDMGAFEFQLQSPPPDPRTDINQDGLRDATDLLLLLQDWHRVSAPSAN